MGMEEEKGERGSNLTFSKDSTEAIKEVVGREGGTL